MAFFFKKLVRWFPNLDHRVWILIAGRLLSQLGTGFTLFYAPIYFVNQVGLSATAVGLGIGSGSISGVIGRILGGSFADSPRIGRRQTLLASAVVSALASVLLVLAHDLPLFVLGNLLMGLGIGLYWPPAEAVVADLTTINQRNEAFALTRLGDSLGLGLGVVLGGALIAATANYRALFVIDGISFVVFFGVIFVAIAETLQPSPHSHSMLQGWGIALRDRILLIYVIVNTLFTTYLALINSALPLYFTNFMPLGDAKGFSPTTISILFSGHVALTALTQLPVARWLNSCKRTQALMFSAVLWGIGFIVTGLTGLTPWFPVVWATLSLGILSLATVAYMPSASTLVINLSPPALRGIYLSVNSLCWAFGYFIGPTLGGWAMDQPAWVAHSFWLLVALSVLVSLAILKYLAGCDRLYHAD
ncbi:MAG TPA: MFS transporter [Chroococcidiopsis sp.]